MKGVCVVVSANRGQSQDTARRGQCDVSNKTILSHNLAAGNLVVSPTFNWVSLFIDHDRADRKGGAGGGHSHTEHYILLLA